MDLETLTKASECLKNHKFSWLYISWFCSKAIGRILAINLDDSYYNHTWCSTVFKTGSLFTPHFDALEESQIGLGIWDLNINFELCKDQLFADSLSA